MFRFHLPSARDCLSRVSLTLAVASTAAAQSALVGWGRVHFDTSWFDQPHFELATGATHTLARLADGSVVAWGDNQALECELPPLPAGVTVVDFDARWRMSLLCLSNGELLCVGRDPWGIGCPPPAGAGRSYVGVDAGVGSHAAALLSDGEAVCWGSNSHGECDVPALPVGLTYVDVVVGDGHTAGLRSDGSLVCWGQNSFGQCDVPPLPSGLTYTHVALGGIHTVALRSDGTVHAFGNNDYGQCDSPALPPGSMYVEISAGDRHTAARRSDGQILCWGDNRSGQCDTPALPAGLTYVEIDAGSISTFARRSDGVTLGWGDSGSARARPMPPLPQGSSYVQVRAGFEHIVVLRSDGESVAWGRNEGRQCDVPPLSAGLSYVEVAAGGWHSLARLSDGTVLAWGTNAGSVPTLPAGVSYVAVEAGGRHSLALRSDGRVVGWGDNGFGQCDAPQLPVGLTYVAIEAGDSHSIALRSDGAAVCWGSNGDGECNVPALPPGVSYVDVSAGGFRMWFPPQYFVIFGFSLAMRSDGELVCWGNDSFGQCSPPQFAGAPWIQFDAGAYHCLAILGDGSVVGWQSNDFLQSRVPALHTNSACVGVAAGHGFNVALLDSSTPLAYCTAGTTTSGCSATIAARTHPSLSRAHACNVTVSNVEGQRSGILFYGLASSSVPWSSGSSSVLCVKRPAQRTSPQSSGGTINSCDGTLTLDWNAFQASNPTALGNPWTLGKKAYVQAWFRDPSAPGSVNLSNALVLTHLP